MQIHIVDNEYQKYVTFECDNGLMLTFERKSNPLMGDTSVVSVDGIKPNKLIMVKNPGQPEEVNKRVFIPRITTGGVIIFATKKVKTNKKCGTG